MSGMKRLAPAPHHITRETLANAENASSTPGGSNTMCSICTLESTNARKKLKIIAELVDCVCVFCASLYSDSKRAPALTGSFSRSKSFRMCVCVCIGKITMDYKFRFT